MGIDPKSIAQVEAETQDEIDQIMNEIENLQTSGAEAPDTEAPGPEAPGADAMEEFRGNGDEPSMEETLGSMKDEESTGGGILDAAIEGIEEEVSMSDTHPTGTEQGAEGTLSMTLTGNMVLKLKYEFGGQDVTIGFADGALRVSLADGTEFKIPVAGKSRDLKAA